MIKRLLLLCLLFSPYAVHAQVSLSLVPCIQATNTPCVSGSQVGNGAQGVPNWESFGILNANMLALQAYLNASISSLGTVTTGTWNATTVTVPYGGTGVQFISGVIKGNGSSAFSAAAASDVTTLFGCGGNAALYPNGAGRCTAPTGSGTVSTSGSPTSGQLAEFTAGSIITGVTIGGDCLLSAATITCTETNGTSFGSLATLSVATVGTGGLNTSTAPSSAQIPVAQSSSAYTPKSMSGDCTLAATGAITCTKINGETLTLNQSGNTFTSSTGNIGTLEVLQNSQSANYVAVLSDSGKMLYNTSASAVTFTIPANGSVAFPVGTTLTFVNSSGGGTVTIAITTDTLQYNPTGSAVVTGSRSEAAGCAATALKTAATIWMMLPSPCIS